MPDKWAELREDVSVAAVTEQELGDDFSDSSDEAGMNHAYSHWGKADALRSVLAMMDRADKEEADA